MTVINMLSLGEEGLAVADEQGTGQIRKSNIHQKLRKLNDLVIYGGSGGADFIMNVYNLVVNYLEEAKRNPELREIHEIANRILISQKNLLRNKCLEANVGIGLNDFLVGSLIDAKMPLAENVRNKAEQIVSRFDEIFNAEILIGGMENGSFCIYEINTSGTGLKTSLPYGSIGSGADESQKTLSNYISNMRRDKRESIDAVDGLAKLIEATNASTRMNVGVGGTISIAYVTKEGIKMPDEDRCRLASEIIEGFTRDLLDKEVTYNALSKLIFENGSFEEIEEEVKQKTIAWEKLDRILRGYKE